MSKNELSDKTKSAISKLKKENQEIAKLLWESMDETHYSYNGKLFNRLADGKKQISEVFAGNRAELIPFLFGPDKNNHVLFEKLWNRLPIYTYQEGYGRRSFRTKERTLLYLSRGLGLIQRLRKAIESGCTLQTYFEYGVQARTATMRNQKIKATPEGTAWEKVDVGFASHLIALALDENDSYVFDRIKEIVGGENTSAGMLTHEIVRGVLMSRNAKAHKLLGDLLLAAKLQEGLRQTILEACDECSVEGFEYILNLVLDNNLDRFSSVVRAMGTWMGLSFADFRPKAVRKALEISGKILADPKHAEKLLDSDDKVELYVALWGVGLREIEATRQPMLALIKSDKRYKRLAGLYFLRQTMDVSLSKSCVMACLDETDLEIWERLLWEVRTVLDGEVTRRRLEERPKKEPKVSHHYGIITVIGEDDEDDIWQMSRYGTFSAGTDRLSDEEIRQIYVTLLKLAESTPKADTRFEKDEFSEQIRRVSADGFLSQLITAAFLLGKKDEDVLVFESLIPKMDSGTKSNLATILLSFDNPKHRSMLVDIFCDPHLGWYRSRVVEHFKDATLSAEEYEKVENSLRLKAAELRKDVIQLLLRRDPEGLKESIEHLVTAKDEQKRLAGLDLIDQAEKLSKEKKEYAPIVAACKTMAVGQATTEKKKGAKKSAAEEILVQKLAEKKAPEYSLANGFGLVDPNGKPNIPEPKKTKTILADLVAKEFPRLIKTLEQLDDLIHKHRDFEYSGCHYYGDERQDYVLGAVDTIFPIRSFVERKTLRNGDTEVCLDDYPLADVWKNFLKESKLSAQDLLLLTLLQATRPSGSYDTEFGEFCEGKDEFKKYAGDFKDWFNTICWPYEKLKKVQSEWNKKFRYPGHINVLLSRYYEEADDASKAESVVDILSGIYHATPKNLFTLPCSTGQTKSYGMDDYVPITLLDTGNPLLTALFSACGGSSRRGFSRFRANIKNKAAFPGFKEQFGVIHAFYEASAFNAELAPQANVLEMAREMNIIDDAELLRELLVRPNRVCLMRDVTDGRMNRYRRRWHSQKKENEYPNFERLLPEVVARILEIELRRGDSKTEVSKLASEIGNFQGIRFFVQILKAMDKTPFQRGYSYSGADSRTSVFCSLLKACQPEEDADPKLFEGIPEHRLLEAAMYAPQWIDLVQKFLGWEGLTSACWYFHAHINETMGETTESIVARYSPITPQRFKDGAFDIDWFNDAHATLGDKRFQMVYDAAKYITSGGNHRRAQIFADALRGKLKIDEVRKSVVDKRNKDNLLAYSLLPLKKGKPGEKEQLERYAFIQNFLKESKKFGQQRKESEGKTCEIAMENLARAAGYDDVNRFVWAMETEKSKEYAKYFVLKKIEGFELSVTVDAFGKPAIRTLKEDDTELKDVPTKLKKHAYVDELKEAVKVFRDQFRSVRENFEKAMGHETEFTVEELSNLSQNPVIKPIIEKLVYHHEKTFGFFSDSVLNDVDGKEGAKKKLQPTDRLIIAHPVHLFEAKTWKPFQKIVFEREIVQPFKQVFRELYLPNADEIKAKTCSRRYAGHQVQPTKTVALLKGRNWTIDPDLGFQKVFYKLDVLIRLYCYADWFTPSDVEPPTIEKIEFVDRKTFETIPLEKIPPVIFSEIMRDLDLVVAVAHVGGVDPEASLSTVEMRAAILDETLKLMKLKNVSFKKSHVMVKGALGEYTVHLGSGEVQMMAGGSLTILPVHSQQRGRLFLPFIDDDPKTAEIMSKTILLAEDDKIKDPTILAAIKG